MPVKQKPFINYHEEKKVDSFTVRFNPEERKQLEADKFILKQSKDSTALKQLAAIGSKVLQDDLTASIVMLIQGNKRKAKRLGMDHF